MRPQTQVVQMTYQNPDADMPMYVPVAVICNTSDEDLVKNIRANSERDLKWLPARPAHNGHAVMVWGGGSVEDHLNDIELLRRAGGTVFAMNAVCQYLREHGVAVDYQVIADAKGETAIVTHGRCVQIISLWIAADCDLACMRRDYATELASEPDSISPGGYLELKKIAGRWRAMEEENYSVEGETPKAVIGS